jgi:hypothetical protein
MPKGGARFPKGKIPPQLRKHLFQKGHGAFPGQGQPSYYQQLCNALTKYKLEKDFDLVDWIVCSSKKKPQFALAVLNKLIANKVQIGLGPEDVETVVNKIVGVITKHITDPKKLEAIAADIEALKLNEGNS